MYTCENCGKEFELPVMVDTGGEYGNTTYTEPASPCCDDNFEEAEANVLPALRSCCILKTNASL